LRDLKEELEEAQEFNDLGRIDAAQCEIEDLASELVGTLGLGAEAGAPTARRRSRPASTSPR